MIRQAVTAEDLRVFRELCEEYARSLDFSLCFQGFAAEMQQLPGAYASPAGQILLAESRGLTAGCVALRPLEDGICEMKRLWVRPEFRRAGYGRRLVERLIEDARGIGYRAMRLDTIRSMDVAIRLYRSCGFREVPPYTQNPLPQVVFLECGLSDARAPVRAAPDFRKSPAEQDTDNETST